MVHQHRFPSPTRVVIHPDAHWSPRTAPTEGLSRSRPGLAGVSLTVGSAGCRPWEPSRRTSAGKLPEASTVSLGGAEGTAGAIMPDETAPLFYTIEKLAKRWLVSPRTIRG